MAGESEYTQRARLIGVTTTLPADTLLLRSATVSERLSALFEVELDLLSEDDCVAATDLLGQTMTVRLALQDESQRFFNGHVSRFAHIGYQGRLARYQAVLVPWLWLLTRTSDCRIFQEMTAPDIIEKVFGDAGFTDYELKLFNGPYRTREYCVQYRETHFNFVSRLMEHEGIYYYFRHEEGKHTLVLADSYSSHGAVAGYEQIPYHAGDLVAVREQDYIDDWSHVAAVRPGAFVHDDFDFTKPNAELRTNAAIDRAHAYSQFEVFDFPGEFVETGEGDRYASVRMEELQADYATVRGESYARGLSVGSLFTLTDYPRDDQNKEYLVISAYHQLQSDEFQTAGTPGTSPLYRSSFTAIDAKEKFRPARVTPRPSIQGPQTAIVAGKQGEEIWTDKYGRVKVLFHWDRESKADENSSCWIRVAQVWAGKGWGGMTIPRRGQEVLVDFLEGDPDRPIITGRVYNAECMPPYGLPDNATMATLKSNSSKGGGGFNEVRFQDKKGEEQLFIHAERNADIRVKNDTFEWVGNERHLIVKADQLEEVGGDKHLTVKGDSNAKVNGTVSLDAGMDLQQKVGMNYALDAGMEVHLKGGMNVIIEAGMSITLKAGGGFIVVGPAGVTISGTPVLINSGGAAGSGSGCSPGAAKAPKEAATAEPGSVSDVQAHPGPPAAAVRGGAAEQGYQNPQAQALASAAESGTPFCEKCEAARRAQAAQGSH
jgi:type VI secretion system secreted protein VgrG